MGRTASNISSPAFVVDPNTEERDNGHQVNWAAFGDEYRDGAVTVTLSADASADATSIAFDAITGPIPAGTVLQFGADEYATLTAAAATGATSVAVEALTTALEDGDEAVYGGAGAKVVPAGTAVALTSGKIVPRTGSAAAKGLMVATAAENDRSAALSGYGLYRGGRFYENLLPSSSDAAWSTIKTELGASFRFDTYANDAA